MSQSINPGQRDWNSDAIAMLKLGIESLNQLIPVNGTETFAVHSLGQI